MSITTLDPYQQEAVDATDQFILVAAGAGSGKTRTLVARTERLLNTGVNPHEICLVTFTVRAAKEMQKRLEKLLGKDVAGVIHISTLHSLGASILRRERPTRRIGGHQCASLVIQALKDLDVRFPFQKAAQVFAQAKESLAEISADSPSLPNIPMKLWPVLLKYQELLNEHLLWDFSDLLVESYRILAANPQAKAHWQQWKHILVDEVQDNSEVEWRLVHSLVAPDTNLYVVGDIAQTIFSWRGALPSYMLNNPLIKGFVRYELPRNYRSDENVVTLANRVMSQPGSLQLEPTRPAETDVTYLPYAQTPHHEASIVLNDIDSGVSIKRFSYSDVCILVRTNAMSEPYEEICLENGIPYEIVGGYKFWKRKEVTNILSYLRLAMGPDAKAARDVINKPNRFLGGGFVLELDKQGGFEALAAGKSLRFSKSYMSDGVSDFRAKVAQLRNALKSGENPGEIAKHILAWYIPYLSTNTVDTEMDDSAVDAAMMVQRVAARYTTLEDMFAFVEKANSSRGKKKDHITISTVHKAKGLEWPRVHVVGLTEKLFPHRRGDYDEEERILYVALTRARDNLLLSHYGDASVFSKIVRNEKETDDTALD